MKSKVTFDLDGQNNPILLVQVSETEDVRDKIAHRFKENLGTSNLCLAYYTPQHLEEHLVILPMNKSEEKTEGLVSFLNIDQRVVLFRHLKKSLDESVKDGSITKEYYMVQDAKPKKGK